MKSKCPRCPLKPLGGPAPFQRGAPLLGSRVQRPEVSSGVCVFLHADLGCALPNVLMSTVFWNQTKRNFSCARLLEAF